MLEMILQLIPLEIVDREEGCSQNYSEWTQDAPGKHVTRKTILAQEATWHWPLARIVVNDRVLCGRKNKS